MVDEQRAGTAEPQRAMAELPAELPSVVPPIVRRAAVPTSVLFARIAGWAQIGIGGFFIFLALAMGGSGHGNQEGNGAFGLLLALAVFMGPGCMAIYAGRLLNAPDTHHKGTALVAVLAILGVIFIILSTPLVTPGSGGPGPFGLLPIMLVVSMVAALREKNKSSRSENVAATTDSK